MPAADSKEATMKTYISEEFESSNPAYFMKMARFLRRCSHCFRKLKRGEKKLKVCSDCMPICARGMHN